jgi:hypothetical protein
MFTDLAKVNHQTNRQNTIIEKEMPSTRIFVYHFFNRKIMVYN